MTIELGRRVDSVCFLLNRKTQNRYKTAVATVAMIPSLWLHAHQRDADVFADANSATAYSALASGPS